MSDTKGFTSVLPLELWQEVIDVLADMELGRGQRSSGALQTCALTCKAWLWHVRSHLHGHITIRSLRQAERFLNALNSSSLSPSIASYVAALEFHETRTGDERPYVHKVLPDFARALRNLKVLAFFNITHSCSTQLALQDGFREVTHLTVQRGRFTDSRDLIGLLSSLPQLQSLELLNVAFASKDGTFEPPPYPVPPHLRAVDVDVLDSFTDAMRWLMRASPRPRITELTLPMPGSADAYPLVGEFLRRTTHLQRLCIQWQMPSTLGYEFVTKSVRNFIDLSVNTALKYVHFDLICVIPAFGVNFSWMPTLIQQLSNAPGLEEIRTSIVFKQRVSNLEDFPWQDVENALVKIKLRSVSWSFLVSLPLQAEAERFVRTKMPRLQSQGILKFLEV